MAINNRYSFEFKQNNGGGGGNKTTTPTTKVEQPTIDSGGIKPNSIGSSRGGSLIDSGTTYTNPYENLTRPTYNDTYEKQYLEYLQNSKDNQKTYLDELKESLKHSSYTDLLRSNVALSNARDTALSHTNTAMTAMGYGSQGYGSTNYSRQQNAYLNALGQNRSAYADRNAEIEQSYQSSMLDAQKNYDEMYLSYLDRLSSNARDEYLAELNNYYNQLNQKNEWDREDYENSLLEEDVANDDLYNSILDNMETAHTSDEKLNNYLTQIGATITDGKVNFDGISGLTNDQKTMLEQRYYAILNGEEESSEDTYFNLDGSFIAYDSDGKRVSYNDGANNHFKGELEEINGLLVDGTAKNGDVFKLTNGSGEYIYVKLVDGQIKGISQADYNNSKNKHDIDYVDVSNVSTALNNMFGDKIQDGFTVTFMNKKYMFKDGKWHTIKN